VVLVLASNPRSIRGGSPRRDAAGARTHTGAGGGIWNANTGHLTIQSKSTVTGNSAPVGFGADLYTLASAHITKDSTVGVIGP
jgi:hypothetical protein